MPRQKSASVEEVYQKKTQLEHILLRPDTYIGSVEKDIQEMWVLDEKADESGVTRMQPRKIEFVPGLYKIFDEILVNAADNKQRDQSMKEIRVVIDEEGGGISVWNDGRGIPIQMHREHNVYVPELIFGHLLTSSNYNDNQKKTTGGRNGFGAKLANIFSRKFIVETVDSNNGKKYKQVWRNNMSQKDEPRITDHSGKDYTKVTFYPDFAKFGMGGFEPGVLALFKKRVYDVAGCTPRDMKVKLNGQLVPVRTFEDYCALHLLDEATERVYARINERWEIVIARSDGKFRHVSHVNSICTIAGGSHVKLIVDKIAESVKASKKLKKELKDRLKPHMIKNHLFVFVNCLIDNPAFGSQTKEKLTTLARKFKETCPIPDSVLKKVLKIGILEDITASMDAKNKRDMKKTDGKKTRRLNIPKLEDANDAGTRYSTECTLILTEGDSAKALAMSGRGVVGSDRYGVFPLKGKLLNVRDCTATQLSGNAEIKNLKTILGLKSGVDYSDQKTFKSLRYGKLMVMTDQDVDGSHIKGLVINFIHKFWPSLLQSPRFMTQFITPIVVCRKGRQEVPFYTLPEFDSWKEAHNNGRGWSVKYYKGLATSSKKEAVKYFQNLARHKIDFRYSGPEDENRIDLAFSKSRVEDRKMWLSNLAEGTFIDFNQPNVTYSEFVDKELILFSQADNMRSIPSVMDGLKPGQRKILYTCFKRKVKKDKKVVQLVGYVLESAAYHHGEMSLTSTIVNMAQTFVGSNNLNLLYPAGQFGSRLKGGKDAGAARYIQTRLCPVTRTLFHPDDDAVLKYLDDDGQIVEPEWYCPVIPLVLVNGAEGIGTGWSTNLPNYSPYDIIANIRRKLRGEPLTAMHPWYLNWRGLMEYDPLHNKYAHYGTVDDISTGNDRTILISELPVKMWTEKYKEHLLKMEEAKQIELGREHITDTKVSFTVKLENEFKWNGNVDDRDFLKKFKLSGSMSISNMVLFAPDGHLKSYSSPLEILNEFYVLRLGMYQKRKDAQIATLERELNKLSNQARFIQMVASDELIVRKKKKTALIDELLDLSFDTVYPEKKAGAASRSSSASDDDMDDGKDAESDVEMDDASSATVSRADVGKGFDYLLGMALWSLTFERLEALEASKRKKHEELQELINTSIKELWRRDLDDFEEKLEEHYAEQRQAAQEMDTGAQASKGKKKGRGKKKSKGKKTTILIPANVTLRNQRDSQETIVRTVDPKEREALEKKRARATALKKKKALKAAAATVTTSESVTPSADTSTATGRQSKSSNTKTTSGGIDTFFKKKTSSTTETSEALSSLSISSASTSTKRGKKRPKAKIETDSDSSDDDIPLRERVRRRRSSMDMDEDKPSSKRSRSQSNQDESPPRKKRKLNNGNGQKSKDPTTLSPSLSNDDDSDFDIDADLMSRSQSTKSSRSSSKRKLGGTTVPSATEPRVLQTKDLNKKGKSRKPNKSKSPKKTPARKKRAILVDNSSSEEEFDLNDENESGSDSDVGRVAVSQSRPSRSRKKATYAEDSDDSDFLMEEVDSEDEYEPSD